MRHAVGILAGIGLACTGAQAGPAGGTIFGIKPLVVNGSTAVIAQALNNSGAIVGSYTDGGGQHGFIRQGKTVTVLPPTRKDCPVQGGCVAFPETINAAGDVAGIFDTNVATLFLWKHGKYDKKSFVAVSSSDDSQPVLGLSHRDEVAFNINAGLGGLYPVAGIPPKLYELEIPGENAFLTGLSETGVLVGLVTTSINGGTTQAAFTGVNGTYQDFAPANAAFVASAAVNSAGAVAGGFTDASQKYHGFVYAKGAYTQFEAPAATSLMTVDAMNKTGRVVGSFVDTASNVQSLFWYNGSTVTAFGKYPVDDYVHLSLNDQGSAVLLVNYGGASTSFTVLCSGPGC